MAPVDSQIGGLPRDLVRRRSTLSLTVESLAFGGRGVAHVGGLAVFVDGGLPGDRLTVEVFRKKRNFAEARIVAVETPSAERVPARCRHFGVCGGCLLQHQGYEAQLESKTRQVRELLAHLGGEPEAAVSPALPSPEIFGYRNKMEFTFTARRWRTKEEFAGVPADSIASNGAEFGLGLHVRGFYEKALNIEECHLPSPDSVAILLRVRALAEDLELPVYDSETGEGLSRFLVLREGRNTGDLLVNFITGDPARVPGGAGHVRTVAETLRAEFPALSTFVHGISTRKASVAVADREEVLFGGGRIHEVLNGLRFEIGPNTFFQTNTRQAERLFGIVCEEAALTGRETVFDLFSGSGTIALHLARSAARVIGVESLPEAVRCAVRNAEANGIGNTTFHVGDLSRVLASGILPAEPAGTATPGDPAHPGPAPGSHPPDLAVLDPPRSGVAPAALRRLVAMGIPRFVYVSCNPATFARDWRLLKESGYRLLRVRPVDMFPHTAHVELVATIERG